ncbi:MAG: hypothetical protein IJP31_00060 [Lachnospiraceae bacterium]|nr:hypothetical protein [Lachnospiraceae bacterium]
MDNFTKWKEQEIAWVKRVEERLVKQLYLIMVGAPLVCMAILAGIALMATETVEITYVVRNALIGLGFGVFCSLLTAVLSRSKVYISKKYLERLGRIVEKELSAEEREEFCKQMCETGKVKEYSWINSEKGEDKVVISQDYLLAADSRGYASLVKLREVETMKTEDSSHSWTTRGSGVKVRTISINYQILFYYHGNVSKKDEDKCIGFESENMRQAVMNDLRALNVG